MSLASKITVGTAFVMAIGTVYYVHHKQLQDREALHEGVIKDVERQQKKKTENMYQLQQQIDLTRQLMNKSALNKSVND